MTAFLRRTVPSELLLTLRNDLGQAQDADEVVWTVLSSSDGHPASGVRMRAVRTGVGSYAATWYADCPTGPYEIAWEYKQDPGDAWSKATDHFFVIDPDQIARAGRVVGLPAPGTLAFESGSLVEGQDGLVLRLLQDGVPVDAFDVSWTILDSAGRQVTAKTAAARAAVGVYCVVWHAAGATSYMVLWEFRQSANSPLQSTKQDFCVVSRSLPYAVVVKQYYPTFARSSGPSRAFAHVACPASCSTHTSSCGSWTSFGPCVSWQPSCAVSSDCVCRCDAAQPVARSVHLPRTVLPSGGEYTDQAKFIIPAGISRVVFWVEYERGSEDGQAIVRLMWSNGVDEVHDTRCQDGTLLAEDMLVPFPESGGVASFSVSADVIGGMTGVRLLVAECGDASNPGIAEIYVTAS